ncbi:MAG: fumarylacetoacetate hydrolase family protein, partial [Microcella pacifica]
MKLANVDARAVLVTGEGRGVDVESASDAHFGPDLSSLFDAWADFTQWASSLDAKPDVTFDMVQLGSPSPVPRQIFAIGLNYRAHAAESGFAGPVDLPPTFTKFASSLSGPVTEVTLPAGGKTDWEVELVVVIGRLAHHISRDDAWDYVAGVTAGQDLSERIV